VPARPITIGMNLKHLAKLARIKLTAKEEVKFKKDLTKVVKHFEELKQVDVEGVEPMNGGTELKNVLREDAVDLDKRTQAVDETGRIIGAFPEEDRGYLKVPKVL